MEYVVYEKTTGSIIKSGFAPSKASAREEVTDNHGVVFGKGNDVDHYVDLADDATKERSTMNPGLTTDVGEARITNIPAGSVVEVGGMNDKVEDEEVTVLFDAPGNYTVRLTNEPKFHPYITEVTVP